MEELILDTDDLATFIHEYSCIDINTINTVLMWETEYMIAKGLAEAGE